VKQMLEKPLRVDDRSPTPPKKKPYVAPVLVRWGTLRDVTQKVGAKGALDGARKGPKNTHL
jgi:hypothetical protein